MNEPLLHIHALDVRLPSNSHYIYPVDGVTLEIHRGEMLCLVGESGSGKSITAKSIMRLVANAEYGEDSEINLDHSDMLSLSEVALRTIRGKKVAIIFQEPMTSLNPVATIGQQITEVLHIHTRISKIAAKTKCLDMLNEVGMGDPEHVFSSYPHQLSGGMRQRVMIAMALSTEPDILIADEPTTALDVTIQAQVLSLIKSLGKRTDMGILMITHDLAIVSNIADTVAVMYAGQIVELAARDDFFAQPKHPYSQKLMACLPSLESSGHPLPMIPGYLPHLHADIKGCRFAPRCSYAWDLCHSHTPELLDNHQTDVRCHLYTTPGKQPPQELEAKVFPPVAKTKADSPSVLEVEHLHVAYPVKKGVFKRTVGHVNAVSDINFTLKKGQTLALVGESGCGKTSTAFALARLLNCASGEVMFQGNNLLNMNQKSLRALRRHIQVIFQDPLSSLNPRMTVREILSEGWDAIGWNKDPDTRETKLLTLLESVGLEPDSLSRYPHEFSGGQDQRIAIARAISMKPEIIICDEPTSALDVSVQAQIINLLRDLQGDSDISYIFISHNIPVVAYLAHHIAVMYLGKIVEYGPTAEIMQDPKHPYTQALLASVPKLSDKPQSLDNAPKGEIPSPAHPPSGCHFHPRCPYAMPQCKVTYPPETHLKDGHTVRCYLFE